MIPPLARNERVPTASAFARIGVLVYVLLIGYASLYPFSGWHQSGVSAFDYLWLPFAHYWTWFDVLTNVLAYIPFGVLMVFAVYPALRREKAALCAVAAGLLLSASMEAMQTFLPNRVPSKLDLLTNITGTAIGALAGLGLSRAFLEQSRLLLMRRRWFLHHAGRGLIVLALWPLAQIYPQGYLFGHGQIMPILSDWLSAWSAVPIDLSMFFRSETELSAKQYWLSETLISTCGLTGAVMTMLCLMRPRAPRGILMLVLVGASLLSKSLSSALLFGPENAFAWLTPGAQGGLLLGLVMLTGLIHAPASAQRQVAALTLLMSLIAVNAVPANPYFISTLQTWVQGKFLNFNGAAQFLSLAWPFFALWYLMRAFNRKQSQQ
ncbi:VanZ family protein [soil metagenome]